MFRGGDFGGRAGDGPTTILGEGDGDAFVFPNISKIFH